MEPLPETEALEIARAWNEEHGGSKYEISVHFDASTACWWIIQVDAEGNVPRGSRPCVTPERELIAFSSNPRIHNFEIAEEVLAEAFVKKTLDPLTIRDVVRSRTSMLRGR